MKKKIDYMKILKWLVNKLNSMTKCGNYHLFKTPYICILQEEIGENCLYPAFEDQYSNGLGSIIAGTTPCKFFKYLVKCIKEDHFEMGDKDIKNNVIDILNLPIEQLQIKADLEQ